MNARSWSSGLGLTNSAWLTNASSIAAMATATHAPKAAAAHTKRWRTMASSTTTAATTVSTVSRSAAGMRTAASVASTPGRVRVGALAEHEAELVQLEADGADGDAQRHQDAQVPRPAPSAGHRQRAPRQHQVGDAGEHDERVEDAAHELQRRTGRTAGRTGRR